jgi:RNA polymerase sigma-B factor
MTGSHDHLSPAARTDMAEFERYRRTSDAALREALVRRFLPLARHLAARYAGRGEREDLEQVAAVALLKAIDRYDPARGMAFSSFAVPTILGELRRYFRDLGWAVRPPRELQELSLRVARAGEELTGRLGRSPTAAELAERCDTSVEHVLEALATRSAHRPESLDRPRYDDEDSETAGERLGAREDPELARAEAAVVVDDLMKVLSERERTILRLRFHEELTQAEIGARMGCSQMHVSRLIRRAIERLHAHADAT